MNKTLASISIWIQLNYKTVYQYQQLHEATLCPSSPQIIQSPPLAQSI